MSSAPTENKDTLTAKRPTVGISALLCLVGAVVVVFAAPEKELLKGALIRVGLLMSALWIAWPTITKAANWKRLSPDGLMIFILTIAAAAALPRLRILIPVAIFIGILNLLVRPKQQK